MSSSIQTAIAVFAVLVFTGSCAGQAGYSTHITVQQARDLVAKSQKGVLSLGQLTTVSPEVATELANQQTRLYLDGLRTLSPEVAEQLAKHKGQYLSLNGLTELSPETLAALAGYRGELSLRGFSTLNIKTLTPELAAVLAKQRAPKLDGVTAISSDIAAVLAKNKSLLELNGLTSMTVPEAAEFAKHEGVSLRLNGLTTLPVEVARELANYQGRHLYLDGLTTLSPEVAGILVQLKLDILSLSGLTSLSPETATALAQQQSRLYLNGLKTLSLDVAVQLAQHRGNALAIGVTDVSPEVAATLAEYKGSFLYLGNLQLLSPEAAAALANQQSRLFLDGLKTLSPEVAEQIAKHQGQYLSLNGLTSLTPEASVALAGYGGELSVSESLKADVKTLTPALAEVFAKLYSPKLDGIKTISPEAAAALAKNQQWLSLDGLTELTPQVAAELAKHVGSGMSLNGLTTLSPDTAKELAKYKGPRLLLRGLRSLSTESAAALANFQGQLQVASETVFSSVKTLTPELAAMLASRLYASTLNLNGLTSLSPEAAKELAKHRDHLMLPRTLQFAPGVAEALAMHQHGRVEWTGFVGVQPDGKTLGPLALVRDSGANIIERRESDSATLRYDDVPKLFFREADSQFFDKPGPELNVERSPVLCWSFSPNGKLLAIGSGARYKQRLESQKTNVSSGYIHVFEVPSGKLLMVTQAPPVSRLGAISKIGFSDDSQTVLFEADQYASPIY